jgi:hypothetical protein
MKIFMRRAIFILVSACWLSATLLPAQMTGQIVVDSRDQSWFRYHQGGSFFLCAPGSPEGFLYRGTQNANGTRNGDQAALLAKLAPTRANGIYLMAVRSHGGDGNSTENPFVDNDPSKGLNQAVLDQWEGWFQTMDQQGIVIFFIFYDDSARIWGSKGNGVAAEEGPFVTALVNRFEHHKHLIWAIAEEYEEKWSTAEAGQLAQIIRAADDHNHPIAVHQLAGLSFDLPTDPNVDQFAIQHDETNPDKVNADMKTAWTDAAGRYNLNLSEAHGWGTGVLSRQNSWAAAMGGAYVMHLEWDIVGTPVARLEECGSLRTFFETVDLSGMSPNNALGYQSTDYVLAFPGERYIAYTRASGSIGLRSLPQGKPLQRWLDTVSGTVVELREPIAGGDTLLTRPNGIGNEAAVAVIYDRIFEDGFEGGSTSAW